MTEYVINCAGERVPVSDKLFENRCSVGNLEDYLAAHSDHLIAEEQNWGAPPRISIVMPIYNAGENFAPTLDSLLSQQWKRPEDVEIILFINQPPGKDTPETLSSIDLAKKYAAHNTGAPTIQWIYEQVDGGLPEVYQRSFSTLVQRIQTHILQQNLSPKEVLVAAIDKTLCESIFAVVDDDLLFADDTALANALEKVEYNKTVVTGEIEVTSVSTAYPQWDTVLTSLMNLFFRFKHEQGSATLTPRAITVKDMFHLPPVAIGTDYADQVWFAAGAANKERIIVKAQTTLEDEKYPSNAQMTARLAEFLANGAAHDALSIFEATKNIYETSCENSKKNHIYTANDVQNLIDALKTRSQQTIESVTTTLLDRRARLL